MGPSEVINRIKRQLSVFDDTLLAHSLNDAIKYIEDFKGSLDDLEGLPTTVFFIAANSGNFEVVNRCINEWGVSPNAKNSLGETVLHALLKQKRLSQSIIERAIELKANPLELNNKNQSLLQYAVRYEIIDCVKFLAENYPQLLAQEDVYHIKPIHEAIDSPEIFKYLLTVYPEYKSNLTPELLHEVLSGDNPKIEIVKIFLKNGVDPNSKVNDMNALELLDFRHPHAIDLMNLLKAKAVIPTSSELDIDVDVPGNGACLYYAVVLSILLPTIRDDERFNKAYTRLFGVREADAVRKMQACLLTYDGTAEFIEEHAAVLQVLIDTRFRARVVDHMRTNSVFFLEIYNRHRVDGSPELDAHGFSDYLDRQKRPGSWGGNLEILSMQQFLDIRIQVQRKQDGNYVSHLNPEEGGAELIKLVFTGNSGEENHYHFIIEAKHIPLIEVPSGDSRGFFLEKASIISTFRGSSAEISAPPLVTKLVTYHEYLLMSQLAYLSSEEVPKEASAGAGTSMAKASATKAVKPSDKDAKATEKEWKPTLEETTLRANGWEITKFNYEDVTSGYAGCIFVHADRHEIVVAHAGTLPSRWLTLRADATGVVKSKSDDVLIDSLLQVSSDKVNVKALVDAGFRLSFTGHSLGGFLAEMSVFSCHRGFVLSCPSARAVTFESPGSVEVMQQWQSHNPAKQVDLSKLNVVSFLSAPNLVNTLHSHPGTIYRLICDLGEKGGVLNFGAYLTEAHSLTKMMTLFDKGGQLIPGSYCEVQNWPLAAYEPTFDLATHPISGVLDGVALKTFKAIKYVISAPVKAAIAIGKAVSGTSSAAATSPTSTHAQPLLAIFAGKEITTLEKLIATDTHYHPRFQARTRAGLADVLNNGYQIREPGPDITKVMPRVHFPAALCDFLEFNAEHQDDLVYQKLLGYKLKDLKLPPYAVTEKEIIVTAGDTTVFVLRDQLVGLAIEHGDLITNIRVKYEVLHSAVTISHENRLAQLTRELAEQNAVCERLSKAKDWAAVALAASKFTELKTQIVELTASLELVKKQSAEKADPNIYASLGAVVIAEGTTAVNSVWGISDTTLEAILKLGAPTTDANIFAPAGVVTTAINAAAFGHIIGEQATASMPKSLIDAIAHSIRTTADRAVLLNSQFSEETLKLLRENRLETLDMGALGFTRLATLKDKTFSLAVLPDGCLASGSFDYLIRLWNSRSGICEAVLSGHVDYVRSLAILPDGRLASGSDDKTIRLWNVRSGVCEAILSGHESYVLSLAVLPDGRLASGSNDSTIRLWNIRSKSCEAVLSGHRDGDGVLSLAVLSGGFLASGSDDKTIRLWNARSGDCIAVLSGHTGSVYSLVVLPDGRLASGSSDTTIRLWNADSGNCEAVLSGHKRSVYSLAVLPDGRLASGSCYNTIRLWNARNGACEAVFLGQEQEDYVYSLAVLLDGRLASCAGNGIKLWPIAPSQSLYSTLKDALSKNNTLKNIVWSGTESLFTDEQHAELKAFLARNQASKIPVPTLPFLSTVREEAAGGASVATAASPSSDEVAKLKDKYEARGTP